MNSMLFLLLQVTTVFFASVAMSMALSHALELPGKLRLGKDNYVAIQAIYYPGFTIGGIAEPLAIIVTLVLLLLTPSSNPAFWWTLTGMIGLAMMQAAYWIITHPVNKFWVKGLELKGVQAGFFSIGSKNPPKRTGNGDQESWKRLRNRWEFSHVVRAIFSVLSLISLTVALAIYGGK